MTEIEVFGSPPDGAALSQLHNCLPFAEKAALMADGDLGYSVPIGGVLASKDQINVSGVGFDIACGNKAVRLDATLEDIRGDLRHIAKVIASRIPFGIGRNR